MKVFASAVGQYDNLGDTVLRRGFLAAVRRAGDLHVYTGRHGEDQISALGLSPADVRITTSQQWRRELGSTTGRVPALYAFDTGEMELTRAVALRYARLAPLLLANRLRGGAAVHAGVGVRRSTPWRRPVAAVLRVCDEVSWRDERSRGVLGLGRVAPDWAFALGADEEELRAEHRRDVLAVAVRASLPHAPRTEPDERWARVVAAAAAGAGLEPVFVAQTGRDGVLAGRLAAAAGATSLEWESPHHATFELRLRALYRRSAVILSDRLHGLIIAATEGAVPVVLAQEEQDKSLRTLAAVGLVGTGIDPALPDGDALLARLRRAEDDRGGVVDAVVAARVPLGELSERFAALGATGRWPRSASW